MWVECKEPYRKPVAGKEVFVTRTDGHGWVDVVSAWWCNGDNTWRYTCGKDKHIEDGHWQVLAYMEYPKPYEQEQMSFL